MGSVPRWWNCFAGCGIRSGDFMSSAASIYSGSMGAIVQARKGTSCSCPQSAFSQVNSNLFGQPSASLMLWRNACPCPQLPHSHSTRKTCMVIFPSARLAQSSAPHYQASRRVILPQSTIIVHEADGLTAFRNLRIGVTVEPNGSQ